MNQKLLERLSVVTEEERRLLNGGALDLSAYSDRVGEVNAERLLETGRLIDIRPNTRFIAFPRHNHNYVEMVYMCAGSQKHIVNGDTEIDLHAGELLLLNQHAFHETGITGAGDIAVNFIVLPQFFDTVLELIGPDNQLSRFIVSGLAGNGRELSYIHFNVSDELPVQNLLENLIYSIVNRSPNRRNINQYTMGLLFLNLLNCTDRLITDAPESVTGGIVLSALREIEENYASASLSCVAQRSNVTPAYVSRLVREMTGKTFKELLLEKRLDKAAVLLRTTRLPIGDIIRLVGYENTSYFYRVFTARCGVSPRKYRESAAGSNG